MADPAVEGAGAELAEDLLVGGPGIGGIRVAAQRLDHQRVGRLERGLLVQGRSRQRFGVPARAQRATSEMVVAEPLRRDRRSRQFERLRSRRMASALALVMRQI